MPRPALWAALLCLTACQAGQPETAPPSPTAANASQAPKPAATASASAKPALKAAKKRTLLANTIDAQGVKGARLAAKALGPEGPQTARSTSPQIYLRNLAGRKVAIKQRLKKTPDGHQALAQLAAWHMEQQLIDGSPQHAEAALAALDKAIAAHPKQLSLRTQRAGLYTHLHQFAKAKADLEQVLAADPNAPGPRRALGKVLYNLGQIDAARPYQNTPPNRPTYRDLGDEAVRQFLDGKIDAADKTLRIAAATYRDVHPVAMAWIDLQRGLLRLRTGRWPAAKRFFESAWQRLPQYYVVAEHLAEVEAKLGNHARALELYDAVVQSTQLPEFMAARAGVLADMGQRDKAAQALRDAEARWDALLAAHGSAYAAHAVDFWLSDRPNPKKARRWAEANLKLRRDPGALVLAARARVADGDKAGARALLLEALPHGPNVDEFHADVAAVWHGLGEAEKATAALERARALNPKTPALD